MKAIKKGYSLAELSMVVLIVSMVSYMVVPSEGWIQQYQLNDRITLDRHQKKPANVRKRQQQYADVHGRSMQAAPGKLKGKLDGRMQ